MRATCPTYHTFLSSQQYVTKSANYRAPIMQSSPFYSQNIHLDPGRGTSNIDGLFHLLWLFWIRPREMAGKIRSVPFIMSLSTAALQHWRPALAGTCYKSNHAPGRDKKDTLAFDYTSLCLTVSYSLPDSQQLHRTVRAADIVYN